MKEFLWFFLIILCGFCIGVSVGFKMMDGKEARTIHTKIKYKIAGCEKSLPRNKNCIYTIIAKEEDDK